MSISVRKHRDERRMGKRQIGRAIDVRMYRIKTSNRQNRQTSINSHSKTTWEGLQGKKSRRDVVVEIKGWKGGYRVPLEVRTHWGGKRGEIRMCEERQRERMISWSKNGSRPSVFGRSSSLGWDFIPG